MLFVKPAGAACNLECRYCYYKGPEVRPSTGARPSTLLGTTLSLSQGRGALSDRTQEQVEGRGPQSGAGEGARGLPRMAADLLERYIAQQFDADPGANVEFAWHGGEPTLLGVDYFRQIVALQRRHCPAGRRFSNGLQTNGLLIDEEWGHFLAAERFRVGLSLDGPADLHDQFRVARGGQPTHARAMRAYDLLQRRGVPLDVLCVVHDANARHPLPVYRFLRRIGARAIGFLPVVNRGLEGAAPPSVTAEAYGAFLCTVFDEWVARDTGRIAVQAFDEATRPARGLEHSLCIFRETCGEVPVLEHDGAVYSCDHFVNDRHRVGSLRNASLARLLQHPAQRAFGAAKRDTLPRVCRACDVLAECHGGCPKDRFILGPDGDAGLNYLCAGYKRFFRHVAPYAARLAREQSARPTLADLVPFEAPPSPRAGRNNPCPCGSGKKFKRCCARAQD